MSSLHFSVKGSKNNPALVFLHGFMGSSNDWGYITSALSDQYFCVSIDLPGHGMSQDVQPDKRHGFRQCHRLIEHVLKQLGIRQYMMIGYSLGGRLAAFHASHHPKGLKALLLESTHPGLEDEAAQTARLRYDFTWVNRLMNDSLEEVLADWYKQPVFANLSDLQRQHQIEIKRQSNPQLLAQMLESTSLARQPELTAKLAKLDCPVALIVGRQDQKFVVLAEKLIPNLRQGTRYCIDNAGHNVHFEQPEIYLETVRSFLQQVEI
ncbi:2-succinyl-6-hydroxy-2,4-cyclohexadiene-1-carboxylate synthase [Celerinatantimonas sp. YJH-8]|uniref:2-succinyl-6-hydroxy-2, 4-cyclohexadiene-1-carboxylate synthase n=1 Tax=Celerinatantimonas sp. YJH-8 TaxID=3228714 RepID=UPI0038C0FB6B